MPTSLPTFPRRRKTSKMLSTFKPSFRTRFEAIPCLSGAAPVNIEEKHTTVRAGYVVSTLSETVPRAIIFSR